MSNDDCPGAGTYAHNFMHWHRTMVTRPRGIGCWDSVLPTKKRDNSIRNPANGYRLFKRADLEKFLKQAEHPVSPRKAK